MKILLLDLFYALCLVIMYSPGLLGWYPNNPSILKAGISILTGFFATAGIIKTNILDSKVPKLLTTKKNYNLEDCVNIYNTLNSRVFRSSINTVQDQLRRANKYHESFDDLLAVKFTKGSMSYAKFMGSVDAAISAVVKTSMLLATRIQMFDESGYLDIKHLIETKAYLKDGIDDSVQNKKYDLYLDNYYSITNMVSSNEEILLELDRLSVEISNMDTRELSESNDTLLLEINNLIDETQYYT